MQACETGSIKVMGARLRDQIWCQGDEIFFCANSCSLICVLQVSHKFCISKSCFDAINTCLLNDTCLAFVVFL